MSARTIPPLVPAAKQSRDIPGEPSEFLMNSVLLLFVLSVAIIVSL